MDPAHWKHHDAHAKADAHSILYKAHLEHVWLNQLQNKAMGLLYMCGFYLVC